MPGKDKKTQAEERYVSEDISLKALAAEVDVKYGTMLKWCKAGEWTRKKKSIREKAVKKAAALAVNKKARELCRLMEASDEVESALLLAARSIARNMGEDAEGLLVTDGRERAGNLSRITQAIGRQTETRMMLSGIMRPADEEKMDLMRRKQEMAEKKEQAEADRDQEGVVVAVDEGTEEISE